MIIPCLLSACGQESTTPTNPDASGSPDTVLPTNTQSDSDTDLTSPEEKSAEVPKPTEVNTEQAEEQTTDTDALFEEFEFSTVEDASLEDDNLDEELYCLGEPIMDSKAKESIISACESISNRLASVTNAGCLAANLIPSQCVSVKNFPILYSEFPPLEGKRPQGRILVIGGTHGDELTSVSMIFRWIEKLNDYHSGLFHWHVVPVMNPDGLLKPAATRTNENGVDLNRNMPSDDWKENALKYWREKTNKNARRYPGETASSEPETKWLIDEINSFKPDAIISVHAPYGVVDFDAQILDIAPKNLGRLLLNLLGTYPGSLGNYAGINRNIPVITLELPHAWVMPSEAETTKLWEDIVAWLRKNINNEESTNE